MSETYTPTAQSFGGGNPVEGFYSPELRGDLGAGLLDLHAMDDTELLSEVCHANMWNCMINVQKQCFILIHQ
jgi:hypothetical protein